MAKTISVTTAWTKYLVTANLAPFNKSFLSNTRPLPMQIKISGVSGTESVETSLEYMDANFDESIFSATPRIPQTNPSMTEITRGFFIIEKTISFFVSFSPFIILNPTAITEKEKMQQKMSMLTM